MKKNEKEISHPIIYEKTSKIEEIKDMTQDKTTDQIKNEKLMQTKEEDK